MPDDQTGEVAQINAIASLAQKSPTLALLILLLGGTGAGTIGTVFVAPLITPYISDAVDEHAEDPRAHATEFERLNEIERRLGTIEGKMDRQGDDIATMNGHVEAVLQLLQQ